MSFTQSIKTCFQKYVDFSGRGSRSEYWWFFLFTFIVRLLTFWIPIVGLLILLGLLLPSLAATVRRLHDTNRTGWCPEFWLFFLFISAHRLGILGFALIPVFGGIGLLSGDEDAFFGGLILGLLFGIALSPTLLFLCGLLNHLGLPGTAQRLRPEQIRPKSSILNTRNRIWALPLQPGSQQSLLFTAATGQLQPAYLRPFARRILHRRQTPNQRRFCTQCGAQLEANARFCTTCGASA